MELGKYTSLFDIERFDSIDSTNNYLKKILNSGEGGNLRNYHTVIASSQSAGRGRRGRTFISPAGCGLYLSVLLYPDISPSDATGITTAAAVAACRAIEKNTDSHPMIKWVNDVYVGNRKVGGILTEASVSPGCAKPDWVIMGIGLNIYEPEGGFAEEIRDIAGYITDDRSADLFDRISSDLLISFYDLTVDLKNCDHSSEYKERSCIIGKDINVIDAAGSRRATALDIDEKCRLIVRYEDGSTETLDSGEVSIRENLYEHA